jgi:hypothetical protein
MTQGDEQVRKNAGGNQANEKARSAAKPKTRVVNGDSLTRPNRVRFQYSRWRSPARLRREGWELRTCKAVGNNEKTTASVPRYLEKKDGKWVMLNWKGSRCAWVS